MGQRSAPLTVAIIGQLAFILIIAAVLALTASYLLLRLYRRAVIKSMRRRSRSEIAEPKGFLPPEPEHKPNDAPLTLNFITREAAGANKQAAVLYRGATRRRWLAAAIHAIAGCCFAATMAAALLSAEKMDFSPFRFLFLTWVNAWPILVAIDLAVGLSRRARLTAATVYFLIGGIIAAFVLAKNPPLPIGWLVSMWLSGNIPATLPLFIFLHRRIRAVGPLVLVFMILGVTGASLIVTLAGNHQELLKAISAFSFSIGLGAKGTLVALHMIGFAAFSIVGWFIVCIFRWLYEMKSIGEQSITIDAVWLLFGIVNSIGLVFEGRWWILSGLVAFVVYKLVMTGLFHAFGLARRAQANGPRLLWLRVFALGDRSENLCATLGQSWRRVGSVQVIAGPGLATSTIEPHEFLDFLGGKLARRFIDSGRTLDLRINQMDLEPDKDGQYRVTEFFCHDDTWKMTLARLADESSAVLMDLRGLSQANSGCELEINELFNFVALPQIVFAIDDSTDQAFMRETIEQAWRQVKERSPNRRSPAGQVSIVQLSRTSAASFDNLLYGLCSVATAKLSP